MGNAGPGTFVNPSARWAALFAPARLASLCALWKALDVGWYASAMEKASEAADTSPALPASAGAVALLESLKEVKKNVTDF